MEKHIRLSKLKKYLFFISMVFLVATASHLSYTYIYDGSKEVAEKWGSISEAIIWKFPHLNPLKQTNDYNDYINHILYRSLLNYNTKKQKIEGDIANCDISNLSNIECFLNDNVSWSNWDAITFDDIIKTYNTIQDTNVNPALKSILSKVEIVENENSISFKSEVEDINTLNIFFQPIVPAKLLENISEEDIAGSFSPIDWIYSWKYMITRVNQDETLGITKIFLEKNTNYYDNPVYIDKFIFKIFKDTSHFLKNKNSVNIFYDKNNLIWSSIPKFEAHKYYLPQYISLFINNEKMPYVNLRNFILKSIDNEELLGKIWNENFKNVTSPFFNDIELKIPDQTIPISKMLESLWYYKKEELIEKLLPWFAKTWTYSAEVEINDNENEENNDDLSNETFTWSVTKDNYLENSKIIYSPDWVDNYNYISKDDILLKWNVPDWVETVYINDYKLSWFNAWDKEFFYRIKISYNNLKEW